MAELGERGQEVYDALTKGREVSGAHKAMALNAARLADTLDRIDTEFALSPHLTVENGQGTITINPLIAESRQITGSLMQILAKLGVAALPEPKSGEKSARDQLAEKRAKRQADIRGSASPDSVQPASSN
ncbi:hypothetical protein FHT44_005109 [Mycolicibacterium sp. BK634]|uniref:hypothetical protein n=1 Tax=Mycolicibacterium sp. BK634 TaxID=2587099 RepID=UPI00161F6EED|nr:hypothetical protein [Mycolicibacterium sp. BK634]MBB3752597.1 hypothetical protein [Mycolicibacterium sp. BK634]